MLEAFASSPNLINYLHPNIYDMAILYFSHSLSDAYYWLFLIGGLNCIFHLLCPFQPLKTYRDQLKDSILLGSFLKLLSQEVK